MRRRLALPLTLLVGAAVAAPISVAAAASTPSPAPSPSSSISDGPDTDGPGAGVDGERFGIVRYDRTARRWAILSTATFESSGLNQVTCAKADGVLTVEFNRLGTVGTFSVDEDDTYAGRYDAGAEARTDQLRIRFRKPGSTAFVPCNAAELQLANSSLQLSVRGTEVLASPSPPPPPISTDPSPSTSGSVDPSPSSDPPPAPGDSPEAR